MANIVDKLMSVPLFMGMPADEMRNLVVKLPLDFTTYEAGETIYHKGDSVESLGLLISGSVVGEKILESGRVTLRQWIGEGVMVFPDFLFGFENTAPMDLRAQEQCSFLWLGKQHVIDMLQASKFCCVNVLNDLCYKAQARYKFGQSEKSDDILRIWIRDVLVNLTYRRSMKIEIEAKAHDLQDVLGIDADDLERNLKKLKSEKMVACEGDVIRLLCRRDYF